MTKVIFEVDKLQETDLIGRLVTSNAGRDTGKSYIVIGLVDDHLLVANGATKTIEMPKKNKIKQKKNGPTAKETFRVLSNGNVRHNSRIHRLRSDCS